MTAQPFNPQLPPTPQRYVQTQMVRKVRTVLNGAVATGDMAIIDGPVGIGKTTAIVEAARTLSKPAVYVNMVGTTGPRDEMNTIWQAITATPAIGSAAQIRDDITDTLKRTPMVLLIDDAHRLHKNGWLTLLNVWNRIHNKYGHGAPIVWCGNNLYDRMARDVSETLSRSCLAYTATPLAGQTLIDTVLAMEPGIADTDPDVLRNINTRYFCGELRRWNQFLNLLAISRNDPTPRPLTDEEAGSILAMMPTRPTR